MMQVLPSWFSCWRTVEGGRWRRVGSATSGFILVGYFFMGDMFLPFSTRTDCSSYLIPEDENVTDFLITI